jgi:hypothetical protein
MPRLPPKCRMKKNGLQFKLIMSLLGGELHLILQRAKGASPLKVSKVFSERKARKWLWIAIAVFVALQIYFVRELLAALMLFTGIFVICATVALVFYLIDRASRWGLGFAGHQAKRALVAAEEISKKQLRRPRSEPAQ